MFSGNFKVCRNSTLKLLTMKWICTLPSHLNVTHLCTTNEHEHGMVAENVRSERYTAAEQQPRAGAEGHTDVHVFSTHLSQLLQ